MKREVRCTVCPMGCLMSVDIDGEDIKVIGNTCIRGERYAKSEVTDPKRTLTSTVKIKSEICFLLPVKTDKPISKSKIFDAMKKIAKTEVKPPIKTGDIIISDFMEDGVNLVSTKTVEK